MGHTKTSVWRYFNRAMLQAFQNLGDPRSSALRGQLFGPDQATLNLGYVRGQSRRAQPMVARRLDVFHDPRGHNLVAQKDSAIRIMAGVAQPHDYRRASIYRRQAGKDSQSAFVQRTLEQPVNKAITPDVIRAPYMAPAPTPMPPGPVAVAEEEDDEHNWKDEVENRVLDAIDFVKDLATTHVNEALATVAQNQYGQITEDERRAIKDERRLLEADQQDLENQRRQLMRQATDEEYRLNQQRREFERQQSDLELPESMRRGGMRIELPPEFSERQLAIERQLEDINRQQLAIAERSSQERQALMPPPGYADQLSNALAILQEQQVQLAAGGSEQARLENQNQTLQIQGMLETLYSATRPAPPALEPAVVQPALEAPAAQPALEAPAAQLALEPPPRPAPQYALEEGTEGPRAERNRTTLESARGARQALATENGRARRTANTSARRLIQEGGDSEDEELLPPPRQRRPRQDPSRQPIFHLNVNEAVMSRLEQLVNATPTSRITEIIEDADGSVARGRVRSQVESINHRDRLNRESLARDRALLARKR